ncbi:hypothetical protein BD289DRAFT_379866 [Coniella lustricola]|uniref:PBP domain-containing protein n=1 Tax=Coniella lustricola TaxID=2025994 RepID=A0A2T2ZS38_9PEZI|nr:hypothetical protein BD289DRAFT_379866 [Coniella lustricola]
MSTSFLHSAIVSHGDIVTEPTEIYGSGPLLLRIGNGGAGATGLIHALSNDYLSTLATARSIAWLCNHSRNTQLALLHGHIDLGLTYERDQEALAAAEGWSVTAGCVMHDHFCLAGPAGDPAGVAHVIAHVASTATSASTLTSMQAALSRIAERKAPFHSRVDQSATMWKERSLWPPGIHPWEHQASASTSSWYRTSLLSPAEALRQAHAQGAYLLTDRSTLLRQVALGQLSASSPDSDGEKQEKKQEMTVFLEPEGENDVLMNSCYAVHSPHPSPEVVAFTEYLRSGRAQRLIAGYGEDAAGLPLFARVADGFAKTRLRGGGIVGGKWSCEYGAGVV